MTAAGILISGAGSFWHVFYHQEAFRIEVAQTGFTTLVTLVLFSGGFNSSQLGLIGEYLARIYDEVKQRPFTL